jgi:hypothetical protein
MGVTFKINNSAKPIFRQVDGEYEPSFRARLFRFFSREAIENMDNILFTPVYGSNPADGSPIYQSYGTHTLNTDIWDHGAPEQQRAMRWIGADSHLRTITKSIPLSVLMGTPDCIVPNLSKFELTINWLPNATGNWTAVTTPGLLECSTTHVDATACRVCVTECHMMLDLYDLHGSKQAQLASDKTVGIIDRLSFIDTEVKQVPYVVGSQIQLSAIENLDAICLMQPNVRYNTTGGGGSVYTCTADAACWGSPGETCLGANSAGTLPANMLLTADAPFGADGTVAPFRSIFIRYGDVVYPEMALSLCPDTAADFSEAYQAYLNACGRAGKRDTSAAIPYHVFKSVMPFIMFRPFADGAPRPSGRRQELIINLTGGVNSTVTIVVFKLVSYRILPDGGLVEVQF